VPTEKIPLSVRYPDVARLWHPTLNGHTMPDSVMPYSMALAWWQCDKVREHVWEASIKNLVRGSRCHFCAGTRVHESTSLARLRAEIASQWHPTKNNDLTPEQVTVSSGKKVWWWCEQGHEWQTSIANRTDGHGCPFCSGRYAMPSKSLAVLFADVAAEWHPSKNRYVHSTPETWHGRENRNIAPHNRPEKNRRLKPTDVLAFSNELIWWRCSVDRKHVWQATISDRTQKKSRCPFCAKRRITDDYNLQELYPKMIGLWHCSRNLPLLPTQVGPGSQQKAWWQCARSADHIFKRSVATIVRSWNAGHNGCPFCHGKAVNKSNSLEQNKLLLSLWHPTRNLPLLPSELTEGSRTVAWWQCLKSSEHIWKAPVSRISMYCASGSMGCPFCRGLRVTKAESAAGKYPELLKYWDASRNKSKSLSECTVGSHFLAWWRCVDDRTHRWERSVKDVLRTLKRGGLLCPQCRLDKT
jgi:hypothetical protein